MEALKGHGREKQKPKVSGALQKLLRAHQKLLDAQAKLSEA